MRNKSRSSFSAGRMLAMGNGRLRGRLLEELESRLLLSLTAADFAGPINVVGTTWVYDTTVGVTDGSSGTLTNVAAGTASFNGMTGLTKLNETAVYHTAPTDTEPSRTLTSTGATYIKLDASGAYSEGDVLNSYAGTVTTTNTTGEQSFPPVLNVGSPFTSTYTETQTQTAADGTVTSTSSNYTETLTLVSDTTTSLHVEAGTFDVYTVRDTVSTDDGVGGTTVSTSLEYVAKGIGIVEVVDADDPSAIPSELKSFVGGGAISFTLQPSNTATNDKFTVKVSVLDSNGSVDTTSSKAITLTLASGLGSTGTLGGTLTVNAVDGVATFNNLTVNKAGQYTLNASDGGNETTSSGLFNITDGQLIFKTAPKSGKSGQALNPAVVVELVDSKGNIITDDSSTVVTLTPIADVSTNPQFSGNTMTLVNGVATFNNLIIKTVDAYKLHATDSNNDTDAITSRFIVSGDHLVFLTAPKDTTTKSVVTIKVAIEDSDNKIVNLGDESVTLTFASTTGGAVPTVTGTLSDQIVDGIAEFEIHSADDEIRILTAGTFTVTATGFDTGDVDPFTAAVTSKAFKVTGAHLVIQKQPVDSSLKKPLPITILLEDSKNKVITDADADETVKLTLNTVSGASGAAFVGTNTTVTFVNGVAQVSLGVVGSSPTVGINGVGTFTYTATAYTTDEDSNLVVDSGTAAVTSKAFKVGAAKMVIKKQPVDTALGQPILPSITLQDFSGKTLDTTSSDGTTYAVHYTLNVISGGQNAVLSGTDVEFVHGVAMAISTATGALVPLSINVPGTYTLTATEIEVDEADAEGTGPVASTPTVTTKSFQVGANKIAIKKQPLDIGVDQPIVITSVLQDFKGKTVNTDPNGETLYFVHYTLNVISSDGTPTLQGSEDVQFIHGTATPLTESSDGSDPMSIGVAGTYTLTAQEFEIGDSGQGEGTVVDTTPAVTSAEFTVHPNHLVITKQPVDTGVFEGIAVTTTLKDFKNRTVTFDASETSLEYVQYTLNITSGGTNATLQGTSHVQIVNGVAVASATSSDPMLIGVDGTYTLTATEIATTDAGETFAPVASTTSVTTSEFEVFPDHLAFIRQPASAKVNGPLVFTVALENFKNQIASDVPPSQGIHYAVNVVSGGAGGIVSGSEVQGYVGGTVIGGGTGNGITALSISAAGTYTLTVEQINRTGEDTFDLITTVLSATSKVFKIS